MNSQQHPSVYEDRKPKSIEDTEKTDGKGIASGQKGTWDQRWEQGNCSPRPTPARPARGLLGESQVNDSLPYQTRLEQHRERPGCLKSQGGEEGQSGKHTETVGTGWGELRVGPCWALMRTVPGLEDSPRSSPSRRGGLWERTGPPLYRVAGLSRRIFLKRKRPSGALWGILLQ